MVEHEPTHWRVLDSLNAGGLLDAEEITKLLPEIRDELTGREWREIFEQPGPFDPTRLTEDQAMKIATLIEGMAYPPMSLEDHEINEMVAQIDGLMCSYTMGLDSRAEQIGMVLDGTPKCGVYLVASVHECGVVEYEVSNGLPMQRSSTVSFFVLHEAAAEFRRQVEANLPAKAGTAHPGTVRCKICGKPCDAETAHRHQGEYVGDECCWDERLRAAE